jgi:hypothetical protein
MLTCRVASASEAARDEVMPRWADAGDVNETERVAIAALVIACVACVVAIASVAMRFRTLSRAVPCIGQPAATGTLGAELLSNKV